MPDAMKDLIASEFHDEEARRQYADELLDAALALQIKTLREQRGLTQTELAERASLGQSQISEMEQIDHSPGTVNTLRRIAAALDLALVIRFESFGQFLQEVSQLDRESLERESYDDDPILHDVPEGPDTSDNTQYAERPYSDFGNVVPISSGRRIRETFVDAEDAETSTESSPLGWVNHG